MRFRVIDGCPVPAGIAPYVYLVLRHAGQNASSIYRGDNARTILHKHGKHTQAEIHRMYPDISNPAGYSQHELRSDGPGTNKGIQRGAKIPVWMCGVDSGGDDTASRQKISAAASHYGWTVAHPYSRGVEGHHWRFDKRPHANRHAGANMWQIIKLRRMLPKS